MAKLFRIWEKKRGERRTGSKLVGRLGEAAFFATLFGLGLLLLVFLGVSHLLNPQPELYQFGVGFWLMLIVLGSFVIIGGVGLIYTGLQVGTSVERRAALARQAADLDLIADQTSSGPYPFIPGDANLTNSPGTTLAYRLPATQTPAWRLLAAGSFCLVWNAIAGLLVWLTVNSLRSGEPEWILLTFVVPFVAIGVWAIAYFARQMAVYTAMGPTHVEVSDHPLRPGREYAFFVSHTGRLDIDWLQVDLVCDEATTFQQGTDVRTEHHCVFRETLFRDEGISIRVAEPFEHRGTFTIPLTAMHSFQAQHNSLQWKLVISGEARRWSEFERSFPMIVMPAGSESDHEELS